MEPIGTFELRPGVARRVVGAIVSAPLVMFCARGAVVLASLEKVPVLGVAAFAFFAIGLALMAAMSLRTRIIFHPERIEFDMLYSRHTIRREEILGWRVTSNQLYFELRDRARGAVLINWAKRGDARIRAWIADVPRFDPDALLLEQEEGPSEIRQQELRSARRLCLALNVAAGVLGVLFVATGSPMLAVALMLVPVVAFSMTGHGSGFIRFEQDYPNGAVGIGIAAGVLALGTAGSATGVDKDEVWLMAVLVGLLFCAAVLRFTALPGRYRMLIAGVLCAALLYGYGTGMQVNMLLDASRPVRHRAEVLGHGGKGSVFRLRLSAWAGRPGRNEVQVPKELWRKTRDGQWVCIDLHAGALGVAWFDHNRIAVCE